MEQKYYYGLSEEGFHRLAYMEWGEPQENVVLAVHGLTRNSRDFDFLADYLAYHGMQVFCPDIVGRGDSDWLKNPLHYTYEQYLADINAMIARTGAETIDFIGTSMGGLIGMVMASFDKSPIRCLVLNDIGPQVPAKGLARLATYSGKDPDFKSLDEAKAYFKTIYQTFGPLHEEEWDHITEHSVTSLGDKFIMKLDYRVKMTSAKSKIAWRSFLHPYKALEGIVFDVDLWHVWRNVQCPVLIIHGEQSDLLTMPIIEKMCEIHPHTEVIQVPNTGHAPMLFDEQIHEHIYHWLEAQK